MRAIDNRAVERATWARPLRLRIALADFHCLIHSYPRQRFAVPGFKIHISVSSGCGVALGVGSLAMGVPIIDCVVAGTFCSLGGILPDMDSASGRPSKEVFGLLGATVPMMLSRRLSDLHWSHDVLVLVAIVTYVVVRFGMARVLSRISVHRGMWHSIPAAGVATILMFLAAECDDVRMRYFRALAVLIGFLSHLLMDEIWSVDLHNKPHIKKSFGTALKFWSTKYKTATVFVYALFFGLLYVAQQHNSELIARVASLEGQVSTVDGQTTIRDGQAVAPNGPAIPASRWNLRHWLPFPERIVDDGGSSRPSAAPDSSFVTGTDGLGQATPSRAAALPESTGSLSPPMLGNWPNPPSPTPDRHATDSAPRGGLYSNRGNVGSLPNSTAPPSLPTNSMPPDPMAPNPLPPNNWIRPPVPAPGNRNDSNFLPPPYVPAQSPGAVSPTRGS